MSSSPSSTPDMFSKQSASSAPDMEYRPLGKSGLRVSSLCLGTMTFSQTGGNNAQHAGLPTCDKAEAFRILDAYVAAGGNFIDTADVYTGGDSETIIGEWLAERSKSDPELRSRLVIATKTGYTMWLDTKQVGASRKRIHDQLAQSLRRLQTDYVDVYIVHVGHLGVPIEESQSTITDLIKGGKVRYAGFSNWAGAHIARQGEFARHRGLEPFTSGQYLYNLLSRHIEADIVDAAAYEGVGLTAFTPLAGGWLTGRHTSSVQADKRAEAGSRVEWATAKGMRNQSVDGNDNPQTYAVLAEVEKIAAETHSSVAAVALRWVAQRPGISSVIVGARTLQQIQSNLAAAALRLSDEQMERLNKVSDKPLPYPHDRISMSIGK